MRSNYSKLLVAAVLAAMAVSATAVTDADARKPLPGAGEVPKRCKGVFGGTLNHDSWTEIDFGFNGKMYKVVVHCNNGTVCYTRPWVAGYAPDRCYYDPASVKAAENPTPAYTGMIGDVPRPPSVDGPGA